MLASFQDQHADPDIMSLAGWKAMHKELIREFFFVHFISTTFEKTLMQTWEGESKLLMDALLRL